LRTITLGDGLISSVVWCGDEEIILTGLRRSPLVGDVFTIEGEAWMVVRAEERYELQRVREDHPS
jgi:hypothetical protein